MALMKEMAGTSARPIVYLLVNVGLLTPGLEHKILDIFIDLPNKAMVELYII
jgi:hypothetical protein